MVIFDLFLFTKKYVEAVKRLDESKRHKKEDVDFEIGALACRSVLRKQPIFVYDLDDLVNLVKAGYEVGKDVNSSEQLVGVGDFPEDSVIPTIIELGSIYKGKFVDPDGQETKFVSAKAFKEILEKHLPER